MSFEVRAGEVVGFAGLVGAGRTDVGLALFGIAPAERGTIAVDGRAGRHPQPRRRDAPRHRLPVRGPAAARAVDAAVGGVEHHAAADRGVTARRFGLLDRDAEDACGRRGSATGCTSARRRCDTPVGNLSGGNQQKTMLAKWLNVAPRVLVLDEPTRGIDVGAKADVHQLIDDLAREGVAVVVISSDLPEVLAMSDRIVVMREGRVRGVFTHDDADPERSWPRRSQHERATRFHSDRVHLCPILCGNGGRSGGGRVRRRDPDVRPERIKELTLLLLIVVTLVGFSFLIDNYLSGALLQPRDPGRRRDGRDGRRAVARDHHAQHRPVGRLDRRRQRLPHRRRARRPPRDAPCSSPCCSPSPSAPLLGLINGALVAYGRIPSIIVTLGTLAIYRTWLISYGEARTITADSLPQWLVDLPRSTVFSIGDFEFRTMFVIGDRRHRRAAVAARPPARRAHRLRHRLQPGGCAAGRAARAPDDGRRLHRVRRARRARRVPAPRPLRDDHGDRRPGPRAGVDRRRRRRRREHARRLRNDRRQLLRGACSSACSTRASCRVPQISEFMRDAVLGLLILLAVVLDGLLARRFVHRRTIMGGGDGGRRIRRRDDGKHRRPREPSRTGGSP